MKAIVFLVVLGCGVVALGGCSPSEPTSKGGEGTTLPPADSGAGAKKGPRIPPNGKK